MASTKEDDNRPTFYEKRVCPNRHFSDAKPQCQVIIPLTKNQFARCCNYALPGFPTCYVHREIGERKVCKRGQCMVAVVDKETGQQRCCQNCATDNAPRELADGTKIRVCATHLRFFDEGRLVKLSQCTLGAKDVIKRLSSEVIQDPEYQDLIQNRAIIRKTEVQFDRGSKLVVEVQTSGGKSAPAEPAKHKERTPVTTPSPSVASAKPKESTPVTTPTTKTTPSPSVASAKPKESTPVTTPTTKTKGSASSESGKIRLYAEFTLPTDVSGLSDGEIREMLAQELDLKDNFTSVELRENYDQQLDKYRSLNNQFMNVSADTRSTRTIAELKKSLAGLVGIDLSDATPDGLTQSYRNYKSYIDFFVGEEEGAKYHENISITKIKSNLDKLIDNNAKNFSLMDYFNLSKQRIQYIRENVINKVLDDHDNGTFAERLKRVRDLLKDGTIKLEPLSSYVQYDSAVTEYMKGLKTRAQNLHITVPEGVTVETLKRLVEEAESKRTSKGTPPPSEKPIPTEAPRTPAQTKEADVPTPTPTPSTPAPTSSTPTSTTPAPKPATSKTKTAPTSATSSTTKSDIPKETIDTTVSEIARKTRSTRRSKRLIQQKFSGVVIPAGAKYSLSYNNKIIHIHNIRNVQQNLIMNVSEGTDNTHETVLFASVDDPTPAKNFEGNPITLEVYVLLMVKEGKVNIGDGAAVGKVISEAKPETEDPRGAVQGKKSSAKNDKLFARGMLDGGKKYTTIMVIETPSGAEDGSGDIKNMYFYRWNENKPKNTERLNVDFMGQEEKKTK